jgi:hypothetical protein
MNRLSGYPTIRIRIRPSFTALCGVLAFPPLPPAPFQPEIPAEGAALAADSALLAAWRRRGQMVLRLPIAPEGIADLVAFNWFDRRCCGDPAAAADAVIDLASAALDGGLKPA